MHKSLLQISDMILIQEICFANVRTGVGKRKLKGNNGEEENTKKLSSPHPNRSHHFPTMDHRKHYIWQITEH